MINQKKGFIARDWVLGTLIFSGLIALMYVMWASAATDYGRTDLIDEDFNNSYNKFARDTDRINTAFDTAGSEQGLTTLGSVELLFQSSFTVINLVFTGVSSFGAQIGDAGERFGIPTDISRIIFPLFLAAIAIIIVFVVVSSVTRDKL